MHTPFIQHLCDHSFFSHTVKIIGCDITSSGNTLTHGSTFYSHGKGSSLAGKFLVEAEGAMEVLAMMILAWLVAAALWAMIMLLVLMPATADR